jgi:hypothetical protein
MRSLRNERVRRAGVREERLRAMSGLRQVGVALSSWRGRSGRRYVVGVHPLAEGGILDITDAVMLAVRRDPAGTAHVIDATTAGSRPVAETRAQWLARMREEGATEVHVHRLAEDAGERQAILDDLSRDGASAA